LIWLATTSAAAQVDEALVGPARLLADRVVEATPLQRVSIMPVGGDHVAHLQYDSAPDGYVSFSLLFPAETFKQEADLAAFRVEATGDEGYVHGALALLPEAFGLDGIEELEQLKQAAVLRVAHADLTESPSGRVFRHIVVKQAIGGVPVARGTLHFTFVDGVFFSFSGRLVRGEDILRAVTLPVVTEDEARLATEAALAQQSIDVLDHRTTSLQLDPQTMAAQWRVVVIANTTEGAETMAALVGAADGEVTQTRVVDQHADRNYRHYQPSNTDYRATGYALTSYDSYVHGANVFAWTGPRTNRSPLATYNSRFWGGGGSYVMFDSRTVASGAHFDSIVNTDEFPTQHAHRWSLRALETADINFTWWPPPSAYKFHGVTLIIDRDDPNGWNAGYGSTGCWNWELWSPVHEDDWPCIRHSSTNWATYGVGDANSIDVLFHEIGHAIDWKYLGGGAREGPDMGACAFDTSDEAESLGEGVGMLYSMMVTLQDFGSNDFTDYLFASDLKTQILWGQVNSGYTVHNGPGTRVCHGFVPNGSGGFLDCNDNKYTYSRPLVQAYWEVAHARTCNSTPCTLFNDGFGRDQARWGLFYALKNTPETGTYRNLVSRFLDYFYYNHNAGWSNRWWVFNGYNLVGTLFTSSAQCN
jgi:hypothetical protein